MCLRKGEDELDFKVLVGFDGFVDSILKPIKVKNQTYYQPFKTIEEFSDYLKEKKGKSCSIEMELQDEKIGGNMPIVSNALGCLGCSPICIGAFGLPNIHHVFKNISDKCKLISVSNPGYCNALEFEDGKLMLAVNTDIDDLDYTKIVMHIGEETLVQYFDECDAVALLNWGEVIKSNSIWENILHRIVPKCSFDKRKIMFIDFSDFSKRSNDDIYKMLEILNEFSKFFDITVSLNENELDLFWKFIGFSDYNNSLEEKALILKKKIPCKNFVIHLLEKACYFEDGVFCEIEKEVVKNPKVITGGGDNFNAGLLFGLLSEMSLKDAVNFGNKLSCLYVKNGRGIKLEEILG